MLRHINIEHWFIPNMQFTLLFDLANYIFIASIILMISRHYKISGSFFTIIAISLSTPFLFNGTLIDWTIFPDQSKYFIGSSSIRKDILINGCFEFNFQDKMFCSTEINNKTTIPNFIFALSPLLNMESFRSIGILNRGFFLVMIIFFYHKKIITGNLLLIFLFMPSIILYSSLALREVIVINLMLFYIYFFFNGRYTLSIISIVMLLFVKSQNTIILIISTLLIYIFGQEKIKIKSLFFFILFLLLLILLFKDQILNSVNYYRQGLFLEQHGRYNSDLALSVYTEKYRINFDLNSILMIGRQFIEFIISPIRNIDSSFKIIVVMENILLPIVFYLSFKKNKKIILIWLSILFFSYLMYAAFIFNDGQIHRYKLPIILFALFGYSLNLQKTKMIKKFLKLKKNK
ncbi:hypothetical protein N8968_00070 [Candidatus Pelagibacter sp.]|nr:hypothetical protein [Candidatus Pelagibacter sp.]